MRKIITICAMVLSCATSYSQEEIVKFSEVLPVEGKSAMDLYKTVRSWFAKTYGDSKEVIQYDQPGEEITGKGIIPFNVGGMVWSNTSGVIHYVISIKFREGRCKVDIENFRHESKTLSRPETWTVGLLYKAENKEEIDKWNKGSFEKKSFRKLYKEVYERAYPLCEIEKKSIIRGIIDEIGKKGAEEDW